MARWARGRSLSAADGAEVMVSIQLDQRDIDRALPEVEAGLHKYCWLQARLFERDVSRDREYQTRFDGFYRVRRNAEWRRAYFELLEEGKSKPVPLAGVLRAIHARTGRVEASFASKLVATVDPSKPVIDSIVFRHLGFKLPTGEPSDRFERIVELYDRLAICFAAYLGTDAGRYLVKRFTEVYPMANVTDVKMLDLVLWQTPEPPNKGMQLSRSATARRRGPRS